MRTSGAVPLTAVAMPEISPPPPIGTTTVTASGTSSSELEPERPVSGDQVRIVEGMDEDAARLLA